MSGRRVVVAAPYPTMPGPEAAASFALVRRLVAAGEDVTVVSPQPSAAHHHADPGGPRGAAKLARLLRGAEVVHLRLDAAAMAAGSGSRSLLPGRLALGAALRRAARREVRLDRVPATVSRPWARIVLGPADRVLVASEGERAALVAAGVDAAKVDVDPEAEMVEAAAASAKRSAPVGSAVVGGAPSAADLEDLVRRRAVEDRAMHRKASTVAEGTASLPLRHLVRMERAPVRSDKPGGAVLKRLLAKGLAWQFDNVIASVNRLHQATIEAVDNLAAERDQAEERPGP